MEDKLLTIQEAAEKLGKDVTVVRRWARTGELPAEKVGRDWVIRESDLEAKRAILTAKRGRPRKDEDE